MDGGQDGRSDQAAEGQRHEIVVAVDEIELSGMFEDFREMKVFRHLGINRAVFFVSLVVVLFRRNSYEAVRPGPTREPPRE